MTAEARAADNMVPTSGEHSFFATNADIQDLDDHQSLWNRVAADTCWQQDPFCARTAWQLSYHAAYDPLRKLIVRQSEDSLVTFAEKIASSGKVCLTPIETMWFFGANVLGSGWPDLLAKLMSDARVHYGPDLLGVQVGAIAPDGTEAAELRRRFSGSFRIFSYAPGTQCAASLVGGVDGFLSRRSANHRRHLKKQGRRAREFGLTFESYVPTSAGEVAGAFDRMIAVELTSWKGKGRCGMAEASPRKFYGAMLQRLAASGDARVMFARHEGKDIGFIFGGMAGKVYRGQQFSYDDEWRKASIGCLLQIEQVRWLCEEGAQRYDLGPLDGPRMDYKRHWTEIELPIVTLVLQER